VKDYSYAIEGLKVRATEPESMGSLIELDLTDLKATADGTFLVSSKALQALGDWAFGVDGLAAQKAGKPAPDREKAPKPSETLHLLNNLMGKVPMIVSHIQRLRATDPIEKGFNAAAAKFVEEETRKIMDEDPTVKEAVREMIRHSLDHALSDDEEEETE